MVESTSISLLEQLRLDPHSVAWEQFVDLYEPFVLGFLRTRGVTEHDAADIVQEVMEVLVRELPSFHHNERRGAFRKWLRTTTANRLKAHWRQVEQAPKAIGGSEFAGIVGQLSDPDSELSKLFEQEHGKHVFAHLFRLVTPHFRPATLAAFQRVYVEQQDAHAVAQDLNMTVNAIFVSVSKVNRAMRELGRGLVD